MIVFLQLFIFFFQETGCSHDELIRKLKERISDLENDNSALVIENADSRVLLL